MPYYSMEETYASPTVEWVALVKGMDNGGDREEEYFWKIPPIGYLLGACCTPGPTVTQIPIPKPIFPQGVLADPAWGQKFSGMYSNMELSLEIPYPDLHPTYDWSFVAWLEPGDKSAQMGRFPLVEVGTSGTPNLWKEENIMIVKAGGPALVNHVGHWTPITVGIKLVGTRVGKKAAIDPLISAKLGSPELADITLVCQGGTFLCHKYVLSLGSPVFKDMFLSQTKDIGEKDHVTIENVTNDILGLVLAWIYGEGITDKLTTPGQRIELFKLAHCFRLSNLKRYLMDDIIRSVTVETAFKVYVLGDACKEERLKAKGAEVMQRHDCSTYALPNPRHEDSSSAFGHHVATIDDVASV